MIEILRETHETPENVARRLCLAGGMNRYGEANYRVVWGWNRVGWIGGEVEERDAGGEFIRGVVGHRGGPANSQGEGWDGGGVGSGGGDGTARGWGGQT